jgi:ribosomal protein S18 acetylase RimI-like enzyme
MFKVRQADIADIEALSNFLKKTGEFFLIKEEPDLYLQRLLSSDSKIIALALDCGSAQVIAIGCVDRISRPRGGQFGYLGEICVDDTYRRKGVARATIKWLVEYSKSLGLHKVVLHCDPAICQLYESAGFITFEIGMVAVFSEDNLSLG